MQTYSAEGITEALDTCQGGGREFHLAIPVFCDLNYGEGLHITPSARCLQARYNKGIANRRGEISGVAIPVSTPERAIKHQNGRRFKENGNPMFTLTSQDRHGVVVDVACLRQVRTDFGKKIRSDYESGKINISRHNF